MILPNSILLQSLSDSIYHEMSSKILKDFIWHFIHLYKIVNQSPVCKLHIRKKSNYKNIHTSVSVYVQEKSHVCVVFVCVCVCRTVVTMQKNDPSIACYD